MALKTTGLKKRKKKGPQRPGYTKGPGHRKGPDKQTAPTSGDKTHPSSSWKPKPKKKPSPGPSETGGNFMPMPKIKPKPGAPKLKPVGPKPKPKPRPKPKPIPPKKPNPKIKPKKGGFGGYVAKYPDLAKAFAKHKKAGGAGTAASWGKRHYEKHGKKEKRKLS